MKQWRILHSEASLGWGGQEMRVLMELEWMRAQGYWVALLSPPDAILSKKAKEAGLRVVPMKNDKLLMPLSILSLALWMLRYRIRIVCTHSSLDGWMAGLAARMIFVRMLVRYRHIEVDYPRIFWSRLAYAYLPHLIVTTSQRIADRLETELDVPKKRLLCIPTGVNLNLFRPDMVSSLPGELKLAPDTLIIGMISVLRSWKGHQVLLDAWKLVKDQHDIGAPIHLVIAGDGPGRDELRAKVAAHPYRDSITVLGHRTDVPNVLASLSILVLPSTAHEGIPQIILQAQAMERAIIGSNIGGIPEVVKDEKTGLLFPPGDAAGLAEKIRRLIQSPTLRQVLGEAARARILAEHSLDAMGIRLLELYGERYR